MRIAILCHTGMGGSGIVATELALALAEVGHYVHLIGEEVPFRLRTGLENPGGNNPSLPFYRDLGENPPTQSLWGRLVEIATNSVSRYFKISDTNDRKGSIHFHEIRPFSYPLFEDMPLTTLRVTNTLAEVVEKYKIEIVHAHYAVPHSTSAILARDAGVPFKIVTTLHGTDVTVVGEDRALKFTTKHAINYSDAVTAVSNSLINQTRVNFNITRDIIKIPNWVDTERFVPRQQSDFRKKFAQPDETILLHASNFRPIKNAPDVIKVFAQVAEAFPTRLILVGDGPEKQNCIQLAESLGVNGRLLSLPSTPAVEQYMGIADFLLLPSENESFGLVALEAMAAGCIVVASNVGGLPELISSGQTGILIEPGDVDGMASSIIRLINDKNSASHIRTASRLESKRYAPSEIVDQYIQLYGQLLA